MIFGLFLVPVRNGAARMTPVKHCQYCSTPVHLYARLCIHCMREIDTAEHIQQMRRARQRIFALIAVTVIAAVGVVSFMVWPDPPPQMQTAVDASPTRTAPEARVEAPAPVVAPAQATEGTKRKITRQPSHDRSLYIDLRLR